MEIYISGRSLDYTIAQWICTSEDEGKCKIEIYISAKSLDYTNARWICTYEDE